MKKHTISIVIPTTGKRQDLLRRAIDSAFIEEKSIFTEIITVANGVEAESFCLPEIKNIPSNASIHIKKTLVGSVSHARNIGIDSATGQWLRFLDDDDFLLPDAAKRQYLELISSEYDISTYAGAIRDESGRTFQTICPDGSQGYGYAVLSPNCPALTFSSVYRLEKIRHLRWNEAWFATEDEDWMRRILQSFTPNWITSDEVVGVWYQHHKDRLSRPIPFNTYYVNRAESILTTIKILVEQKRFNDIQKKSAANGLWSAIHGGFYLSPIHWSKLSIIARRLDKSSRPKDKIFTSLPWVHPLIIEWLFLPKRIINHAYRVIYGRLAGFNIIRKI